MKQVNNAIVKSSPTLSMSADAQGHIRAEAVRFIERTGVVTTDDEALAGIVYEHNELHRLITNESVVDDPNIDSVSKLVSALEEDTLRLVDANEDTALYKFRADVLAALQDPAAMQSAQTLQSRIGMLGVANGWWRSAHIATETTA